MSFTEKETEVFQEILEWEKQLFQYEATDLKLTIEKYFEQSLLLLPIEAREQVFSVINHGCSTYTPSFKARKYKWMPRSGF